MIGKLYLFKINIMKTLLKIPFWVIGSIIIGIVCIIECILKMLVWIILAFIALILYIFLPITKNWTIPDPIEPIIDWAKDPFVWTFRVYNIYKI